jgi:hypothetical protein
VNSLTSTPVQRKTILRCDRIAKVISPGEPHVIREDLCYGIRCRCDNTVRCFPTLKVRFSTISVFVSGGVGPPIALSVSNCVIGVVFANLALIPIGRLSLSFSLFRA